MNEDLEILPWAIEIGTDRERERERERVYLRERERERERERVCIWERERQRELMIMMVIRLQCYGRLQQKIKFFHGSYIAYELIKCSAIIFLF